MWRSSQASWPHSRQRYHQVRKLPRRQDCIKGCIKYQDDLSANQPITVKDLTNPHNSHANCSWCRGSSQDYPVHWLRPLQVPPAMQRETRSPLYWPPPHASQSASILQQARQPRPICWMRPKPLPPTTQTNVKETTTADERLMRAGKPELKKLLFRLLGSLAKPTQLNATVLFEVTGDLTTNMFTATSNYGCHWST